jgi:hypothetical protein
MRITIEIHRPNWMTWARLRRAGPLVVLLVALALAAPVLAFDRFTDVGPGPHHDDITAIAAAGITQGCNPPTNDQYCPDQLVRRDQMGSFLARAAGLGTNPPVANADKLDGLDSSAFYAEGSKVADSDQLDGLDSTAFLPAGDYTVMQHGPWVPSNLSAVTTNAAVNVYNITSTAAGERFVQLALDGPASVGGTGYGFKSARICYLSSGGVTIDRTEVWQTTDTSASALVTDLTNRDMAGNACYIVTDTTPTIQTGGTTLRLDLEFAAANFALLTAVTTTWTPVSP